MFEKLQASLRMAAKIQAQKAQIEDLTIKYHEALDTALELSDRIEDIRNSDELGELRRRVAALKAQNDELCMVNAILRHKLYRLLEEKEA